MKYIFYFLIIAGTLIFINNLEARCSFSVGLNECYYEDGQLYYVYVPIKAIKNIKNAKLLVSVHGYSGRLQSRRGTRRVKRAAKRWRKVANRLGIIVLAPQFDRHRFKNDYQRLNIRGPRADIRLNTLVAIIGKRFPGMNTKKIYFFGFSGGGQFVHRYAALHPEKIAKAVAGGAGWYMWPDKRYIYPVGIRVPSRYKDFKIKLKELCSVKLLVLVGKMDEGRGAYRNRRRKLDLNSIQGRGRHQRGENWVRLMKAFAKKNKIPCNIEFGSVRGVGHKVSRRFKRLSIEYLLY